MANKRKQILAIRIRAAILKSDQRAVFFTVIPPSKIQVAEQSEEITLWELAEDTINPPDWTPPIERYPCHSTRTPSPTSIKTS
jgi:hypothetical protein